MATPTDTWTSIAVSEVQANRPITATLASRWAFNLNAAMQGASGAQRLYVGALERLTAGATQRAYNSGPFSYTSSTATPYLTIWEFGVTQGGTLRLGGQSRWFNAGVSSDAVFRVQRIRAGATVTVVLRSTTSTSYDTNTTDIACQPGDLFRFQIGSGSGPNIGAEARNLTVSTNGEDLFPCEGLFGYIDANTALT